MIKQGILHGLLLIGVVASVYVILSGVSGISGSLVGGVPQLLYLLLVGVLGYSYKKKHGKTLSLTDGASNKSLLMYSFGAALGFLAVIPLLFLSGSGNVPDSIGWPTIVFFLLPLGLAVQTIQFAFLFAAGGWFCRN
jgi:hypothetical protein